ncbi:MAG: glycosyltransferase family 4 protein [Bacteroidia bacterium]
MRILQLCNKAPYPANDGSSIAIYNMALGFMENNADLTLLTINTKKHFKPDVNVPEEFKRKSNYTSIYRNADVNPIGALLNLFSDQSYFISRFYFEEFENALTSILKKKNFDLIHIEGLFMATYIPLIKKYSKAKISIRTHNIEHLIWERLIMNETDPVKKKYLGIQNKRLKKFEMEVLPAVDAIVTITEQDKNYFESLGIENKYLVSPTGIELSQYKLNTAAIEKFSLFHFGSMDWMPNVEAVEWFLDNVWSKYFADKPDYTFYIAGRNMPQNLQQLVYKNVKVISEVSDSIDFYNSKQLMLVPLLSGSGMRIKIIEGMAMGKAIISTGIGAEGIPVSHRENILIADTPAEFAESINELFANPALRENLEKNARELIRTQFNNKKLVAEVLSFYQTLLN